MTRIFITLGLLLLLIACSNSPQQVKQYYRLTSDSSLNITENSHTNQLRDSVIITRPEALSILGGRPMVATRDDGSLVQLNHHYWLESPKVLLQDRLQEWATRHWQEVLSSGNITATRDRLVTRILAFEKNQNQAHIHLEFTLINGNNDILFSKAFNDTVSLSTNSFAAFAQAADQTVSNMLQQLSQVINQNLKLTP